MAMRARQQIADESREQRLKMRDLMESGASERDAFRQAVPDERNVKRMLDLWRKHGLWPVPNEELATAQIVSDPIGPQETSGNVSDSIGKVRTTEDSTVMPNDHPSDPDTIEQEDPSLDESEPLGRFLSEEPSEAIRQVLKSEDAAAIGNGRKVSETWVTQEEFERAIAKMTDAIRGIQERITISTMFQTGQTVSDRSSDEAPRPPMKGKAYEGKRGKLGCTVDSELLSLVKKECEQRKVTASTLLDRILWLYFGRPRLSFEPQEPESDEMS